MPKLSNGKETVSVRTNTSLVEYGEEIGIPFSCTEGNCGTCLSRIVSGLENLSPYTDKEKMFGLESDERLICQAQILKGTVVVEN